MRSPIRMVAVAACVLGVSSAVMAHSHHQDSHHQDSHHHDNHHHGDHHDHGDVRHADAHVHGQGELNFATEGSELHMELMVPAHDILGFETITTHAQKKQLNDALATLESEAIWSLSDAAQCQLISAHASPTKEVHVKEEHDHGDDHKDHKHHSDHKNGHDHDHDHDCDHDHDHDGHMDISASYVFQCKQVNQLNQLSTTLFEAFPRSERIRVQGFTQSGQLSETMTPAQPQVRF